MSQLEACTSHSWPVSHYIDEIRAGRIETKPRFQRNLVWDEAKKSRLIDSIIRGFPIPPIWLWQKPHDKDHRARYSVIDGQQRLSTLTGFFAGDFPYKKDKKSLIESEDAEKAHGCGINTPNNPGRHTEIPDNVRYRILNAQIPCITISGNNPSIAVEAFMRLNTSSSQLNQQELRNAIFEGHFKSFIYGLVEKYKSDQYWGTPPRIFKPIDQDRMAREALISAIAASLIHDGALDKDARIHQCYKDYDASFSRRDEIEKRLKFSLDIIKKVFNDKSLQRFSTNHSDFYSIIRVIDHLKVKYQATLNDSPEWLEAEASLKATCKNLAWFATEKAHNIRMGTPEFAELGEVYPIEARYWASVNGAQKELGHRHGREMILRDILTPPWRAKDKKDPQRSFSSTVKELVWVRDSDDAGVEAPCAKCNNSFKRDEIEFDHIEPWSKGGSSSIQNCQLLCAPCNKQKGSSTGSNQ